MNDAEPVPPGGEVSRPDFLSPAAETVWSQIAPVAIAMGTLTQADVSAFATFCELEATRRETARVKGGKGSLFSVERNDEGEPLELVVDAVLKAERDTANALRPYYEKFGLEPAGRARIRVPKPAKQDNKWEAMGCA